jgi:hypothetical protein
MSTVDTSRDVERRAIEQLRLRVQQANPTISFDPAYPDYLANAADNLIAGLTLDRVARELESADGGELADQGTRPAKFRAIRSSSALAVNTFAPWRDHADPMPLAGELVEPATLQLEAKRRPLAHGRAANLDALGATDQGTIVAVESKLLEPLNAKAAKFQDAYEVIADDPLDPRRDSRWYAHVSETPVRRHLDIGQLIRHYLALARCHTGVPIVLVYAFWEPADASEFEVFGTHRDEIAAFASSVANDPQVRFAPICYRDLWDAWAWSDSPPWLADHVARLRARYDVRLAG